MQLTGTTQLESTANDWHAEIGWRAGEGRG